MDDYIGEDVYYLYYYIFRIIFVHICPCSALVLLNVLLFRALSRTAATRERLFAGALAGTGSGVGAATTSFGGITQECNVTSFYSQYGISNNNSKASLPYNNCLTPLKTSTATMTTTIANGQSKQRSDAGSQMMVFSAEGAVSTTTNANEQDSPPGGFSSSCNDSRKVSLEESNNNGGGK